MASKGTQENVKTNDETTGISIIATNEGGVLSSLRELDELRANATNVQRLEGSNLDFWIDGTTGQEIVLAHFTGLVPFTAGGSFKPFHIGFEDTASIALAAHHLNTGDGSIIPQVAGLSETCKIRFTVEMADSAFDGGTSLRLINELTGRDLQEPKPRPTAFLGPYRSAVCMSTSIINGALGYPQVSPGAAAPELDDKTQYPLFGRTVPSDEGRNLPVVLYLAQVLQLQHLAVIYVNDAYGNAFIEYLRRVADIHAPQLDIQAFSISFKDRSVPGAIESVKATGFRFIFCAFLQVDAFDEVVIEGYNQGIAGTGVHNWLFNAAFSGVLPGRKFEKNSPLHLAYRGSGLIQVSAGVEGLPQYDAWRKQMSDLNNPEDIDFLISKFPKHNEPAWDVEQYRSDPDYLREIAHSFTGFAYEATIGLGLAACSAVDSDNRLTGADHFESFKFTTYNGITGNLVAFNNVTGTRNPDSALSEVTNYIDREEEDGTIVFEPVLSSLFLDSEWKIMEEYSFNDGTTNIPVDIAAPEREEDEIWSLPVLIAGPSMVLLILGILYLIRRDSKRRANDTAWHVKSSELKFDEPPQVLGTGTFGVVVMATYRGTQVAVKRVLPPQQQTITKGRFDKLSEGPQTSKTSSEDRTSDVPSTTKSGVNPTHHVSKFSSLERAKPDKRTYNRLKEEFAKEMQYISRLRHPNITTVMGAVFEKGQEPMLVMELMEHGSLRDIIHNEILALDSEIILPILRDIAQGLRFLHTADPQIIHGDLKAQNILVDSRFHAKVADFGLSQKKHLGGTGTPFWMAPELLRKESPNTTASDVFSFGVVLYEVFSRKDPYKGEDSTDVLKGIMDKAVRKRVTAPKDMPPTIKVLMGECMEEDPKERPSFEEIDSRVQRLKEESVGTVSKKSHVSMFDIFPRHVAEALRDGRKVEPEHKDVVTIFFSDIVGFTDISAELEPHKVANMLGRLYTRFDELSNIHDCYKVETIGDAYVAVTNLVKDQADDHCRRIAAFAMDAVKAANHVLIDEDNPDRGCINIRVGFHSGPVVADVVGNRNPRYCLFGDTVNVASRMESNSEANRINCSAKAAKILKDQWSNAPLFSRGNIVIKGKGIMRCYWVGETESNPKNILVVDDQSEPMNSGDSFDLVDLENNLMGRLGK